MGKRRQDNKKKIQAKASSNFSLLFRGLFLFVLSLIILLPPNIAESSLAVNTWKQVSNPGGQHADVWVSPDEQAYAVGMNNGDGYVLHYDGSNWSAMLVPAGTPKLNSIWGFSTSDIFAVGNDGTILHYDGLNWTRMNNNNMVHLSDVWGSLSADVFAVGRNGVILHFNGTSWSRMSSGTSAHLFGIWGNSGSDVFTVGAGGTILHYNGITWEPMDSGTSNDLYCVWSSSGTNVFAGGAGGTVNGTVQGKMLHYDGISWSEMALGVNATLFTDIWGAAANKVFTAGYRGAIFHFDGTDWELMNSGGAWNLAGLHGSSGYDVYAVAWDGTVLHHPPDVFELSGTSVVTNVYGEGTWEGINGDPITGDMSYVIEMHGDIELTYVYRATLFGGQGGWEGWYGFSPVYKDGIAWVNGLDFEVAGYKQGDILSQSYGTAIWNAQENRYERTWESESEGTRNNNHGWTTDGSNFTVDFDWYGQMSGILYAYTYGGTQYETSGTWVVPDMGGSGTGTWTGIATRSHSGQMDDVVAGSGTIVATGSPTYAELDYNISEDGTFFISHYQSNPGDIPPKPGFGKFIQVDTNLLAPDINWAGMQLRLYYSDEEISAAGLDESSLEMYRWDGTALEWTAVAETGVNTEDNYVWANLTSFSVYTALGEELEGYDFGDAPDPYPTLLADDGARHVATGPMLGFFRDTEPDGQPTFGADGDDLDSPINDEDGVIFYAPITARADGPTTAAVDIILQNADATSNLLNAWIDFNQNGDWDDPGEQIFTDYDLGTADGTFTLTFDIPQADGQALVLGDTYARFRLSTQSGLSYTGLANDGEVEDYLVTLVPDSWSDNFDDGPQQDWHIIDNGDNSSAAFSDGKYILSTVNQYQLSPKGLFSYVHGNAYDAVISARIQPVAPEDQYYLPGVGLRGDFDSLTGYFAAISNTGNFSLGKRDGDYIEVLKDIPDLTDVDLDDFWLKMAAIGTSIYAKVWSASEPEPVHWMLMATDSDFTDGNGFIFVGTGGGGLYMPSSRAAFDYVSYTADLSAACTVALDPSSEDFDAHGGTGMVWVDASLSTCEWIASSNEDWITIDVGDSGTGVGDVEYTVAENDTGVARTGTLTIAGETFTVNQDAGECIYSISPSYQSVAQIGDTVSVSVETSLSYCEWSAFSNNGWISISTPSSGTGNGTFEYTVDLNPDGLPRTGTLAIADETLTVAQAGTGGVDVWEESFTGNTSIETWVKIADVGENNSAVFANNRYEFFVQDLGSQLFYSVQKITGDSIFQGRVQRIEENEFMASAVLRGNPETGTGYVVIVTSSPEPTIQIMKLLGVGQAPEVLGSVPLPINLDDFQLKFAAIGNQLYAKAWSTGESEPDIWDIIVVDNAYSMGATAIGLLSGAFSGAKVAFDDLSLTTDLSSLCFYSAYHVSDLFAASGGTGSIEVETEYDFCGWTAVAEAPANAWITFTQGPDYTGNATDTYSVAANTGAASRAGTITVAGEAFRVYQAGTGGVQEYYDDFAGNTPKEDWVEIANVGETNSAQFVNNRFEFSVEGTGAQLFYGVEKIAVDALFQGRVQQIAPGDDFIASVILRGDKENGTGYVLNIISYPSPTATIFKLFGDGTDAVQLDIAPLEFDITDSQVKFAAVGSHLYAKIWPTDEAEPKEWQISAFDEGYTIGASAIGLLASGVSQDGQVAFDDVSLTTDLSGLCSYSLYPRAQTGNHEEGASAFDITVYPEGCSVCEWAATSNDPSWLAIDAGSTTGAGDSKVHFSYNAQEASSPRTGSIDISDSGALKETFQFKQGGKPLWEESFTGNSYEQPWIYVHTFDPGDTYTATINNERLEFNLNTSLPPKDKFLTGAVESHTIQDGIIQARYQGISDSFMANLVLRMDTENLNGYGFGWDAFGNIWIGKRVNGKGEGLVVKQFDSHYPFDCMVKFAAIGNKLFGKIWTYGEDEPERWMIEYTDDPYSPDYHSSGKAGVGMFTWHINYTYINNGQGAFDDVKLFAADAFWTESETSTGKMIETSASETVAVGNSALEVTSSAAGSTFVTIVDSNDEPFHKYTGGIFGNEMINKQVLVASGLLNGDHKTVVKLKYADSDIGGIDEQDLRLFYWSDRFSSRKYAVSGNTNPPSNPESTWQGDMAAPSVATAVLSHHGVDTVNNILWAVVDHYSDFNLGVTNVEGWSLQDANEMRWGDDTQPLTSVTLTPGEAYVWVSDVPVAEATTYSNAAWTGQLSFNESVPGSDNFFIEVGHTSSLPGDFVPGNPSVIIVGEGLPKVYQFDTGESGDLDVPAGQYVAMRVTNNSASNTYTVLTGGLRSWLNAPGTSQENFYLSSNTFDGDATFTDQSPSQHEVEAYGNVAHVAFGADTAIRFDGDGDYLYMEDSEDWDFGTGDFTIDLWVNPSAMPSLFASLLSTDDGSNNGYFLRLYADGRVGLDYRIDGTYHVGLRSTPVLTTGAWYHVAVVREGDTITLYINGIIEDSITESGNMNSGGTGVVISRWHPNKDGAYFNGHMDEIRINKGTTRWTEDFSGNLPQSPAGEIATITILQTSDLHNRASGYGPYLDYSPDSINNDSVLGGYARLATIINDVRNEVSDTLLIDSGDFMMGTPYDLFPSDISLQFFEAMGYDAVTLGNHEFDWAPNPDSLAAVISNVVSGFTIPSLATNFTVPIVASNMGSYDTGETPGMKSLVDSGAIVPTKVITLENGLTVGILGLLGPEAQGLAPMHKPLTFNNGPDGYGNYSWNVPAIQAMVSALKDNSENPADMVIVLSHSGINNDYASGDDFVLAKNVTGIDIIASGHAHTLTGDKVVVPHDTEPWETIIFSPGSYGEVLSRLDVSFNLSQGRILTADFTPIPVDDTVYGDPAVNSMVNAYNTFIDQNVIDPLTLDEPVSHTGFELTRSPLDPITRINNLGSLSADAVRYAATLYGSAPCKVGVVASGVVRNDIHPTQLPGSKGAITFADIYTVLPLGNNPLDPQLYGLTGYPLMEMDLTPFEMYLIAELGLTGSMEEGYGTFYLNFSGLQIEYDIAGAPGFQGVKSIRLYDTADTFCEGALAEPLNPYDDFTTIRGAIDAYGLAMLDAANGLLAMQLGPFPGPFPEEIFDPDRTNYIEPQNIAPLMDGPLPHVPGYQALQEFLKEHFDYDAVNGTVNPDTYGANGSILERITAPSVDAHLWIRSNDKDAGDAIVDTTGNHGVAVYGDVYHENPFGADSAIAFDGDGDYLYMEDSEDWDFGTGDFTIDLWVNPTALPSLFASLLSTDGGAGGNGYFLRLYADGRVGLDYRINGTYHVGLRSTPLLTADTWSHVAVVRKDSTITLYVDGMAEDTITESRNMNSGGAGLVISRWDPNKDGAFFNGHMDEIRILKGTARWEDDFAGSLPNIPYSVFEFAAYIDSNENGSFDPGEASFETIQAAIDEAQAGETVRVVPGTHNENITITTTLSLIGDNKTTTIIDGGGTGIVVTIAADDVTMSGFTVQNSGSDPQAHAGIVLAGATGCTIEDNIVKDNLSAGIGLQYADDNTIRNNTITNNYVAGIALIASSNNTIEGNTASSTSHYPTTTYGYGIILDSAGGEPPVAFSTGNTITGNTLEENDQNGIYFGERCDSNTVTDNTISGNGHDGVFFWKSGTNTVTGNTITGNVLNGIHLMASQDNTITGNIISGNDQGFLIRSGNINYGSGWVDLPSTGNAIHNNAIFDNAFGMANEDDTITVNASGNWWDSSDPGAVVSDHVDYSPWLSAEPGTSPMTWYVDASGSIQDAVDAAADGDSIIVKAGIYAENITVYRDVSLSAENPPDTGDASYINGMVHITSDGVVLEGFYVTTGGYVHTNDDSEGYSIRITAASNVLVQNNVVYGITGDASGGSFSLRGIYIYSCDGDSNIDIVNNDISDVTNGGDPIYGGAAGITVQGWISDVAITGNTISDINSAGWAYGIEDTASGSIGCEGKWPTNLTITGNDIRFVNQDVTLGGEYDVLSDPYAAPYGGVGFVVDASATLPCDASGVIALSGNSFEDMPLGVVNKDTVNALDATLNWWGDASGPGAPDGSGSGVGVISGDPFGEVIFSPWLEGTFPSNLWIRSDDKVAGDAIVDTTGNHGVAVYGNVYHENPFGADSAIAFDGSGDYLYMEDSEDWDFGTGDFTIDLWVNPTALPSTFASLLSTDGGTGSNGYFLRLYADGRVGLDYRINGTYHVGLRSTPLLTADTWSHVAVVRKDSTIILYVDGMVEDSITESGNMNSGGVGMVISRWDPNRDGAYFNGHMDEIRILKGTARWENDFMPPLDPDIQ